MTDPIYLAAAFVLGVGATLVWQSLLEYIHAHLDRKEEDVRAELAALQARIRAARRPDATECWPGPTVIDAQIQRIKWGLRQRDLITRARALEADTEARPPETVASTPPDERRSGGGA